MNKKTFRIFLSSTFSDFQRERDYLKEMVWPKISEWCAMHGFSFQVVDLRWGISSELAKNHETIRTCMEEIKQCQNLSLKPNFIVLLGNRYGWRPLPSSIPEDEFEEILRFYSGDATATESLKQWYRLDTNSIPPHYALQSYQSQAEWDQVEDVLSSLLRHAANGLGVTHARRKLYFLSATHLEIVDGLLEIEDANEHVFVFDRRISNLNSTANEVSKAYSDFLPGNELDTEAQEYLNLLRSHIESKLPDEHIYRYSSVWQENSVDPIDRSYLEALAADIEASLIGLMKLQIAEMVTKDQLEEEIEAHQSFAKQIHKDVLGRDRELESILSYVSGVYSAKPAGYCIVHGAAGIGKSAVIATALEKLDALQPKANVIGRFIGATPRSWTPEFFLADLIGQIRRFYNQPHGQFPKWNSQVYSRLLLSSLKLASEGNPLVVLIDAIDQFDNVAQFTRDLLPTQLPPHVAVIISVLSGGQQEELISIWSDVKQVALKPLMPETSSDILTSLLENGGATNDPRRLSSEQMMNLLQNTDGSPLYVSLLAPLAHSLKSWDTPPALPHTVDELAQLVISRASDVHGSTITKRALGYIACSRFGLSERELEAILWRDHDVRKEFYARNINKTTLSALPQIIWARLHRQFASYIHLHMMDGELLYRFFHRVFHEVTKNINASELAFLHSNLADYFSSDDVPKARKAMVLPYHLDQSGRSEEAERLITDFGFSMEKCALNRAEDWIHDFRRILPKLQVQQPKTAIYLKFLGENGHILKQGNDAWTSNKILLQLALESNEPVLASEAQSYVEKGKCDWLFLKNISKTETRINISDSNPEKVVSSAELSSNIAYTLDTGGRLASISILADNRFIAWRDDGVFSIYSLCDLEPLSDPIDVHRCKESYNQNNFLNSYCRFEAASLDDGSICTWSRFSLETDIRNSDIEFDLASLFSKSKRVILPYQEKAWLLLYKTVAFSRDLLITDTLTKREPVFNCVKFDDYTGIPDDLIKNIVEIPVQGGRMLKQNKQNKSFFTLFLGNQMASDPIEANGSVEMIYKGISYIVYWKDNGKIQRRNTLSFRDKKLQVVGLLTGIKKIVFYNDLLLAILKDDAATYVLSPDTLKVIGVIGLHAEEIADLLVTGNGDLLSWSKDGKVVKWGRQIHYCSCDGPLSNLYFTNIELIGEEHVAVWTGDRFVKLLSVETGELVDTIVCDEPVVKVIALSEGTVLISCRKERAEWNPDEWELLLFRYQWQGNKYEEFDQIYYDDSIYDVFAVDMSTIIICLTDYDSCRYVLFNVNNEESIVLYTSLERMLGFKSLGEGKYVTGSTNAIEIRDSQRNGPKFIINHPGDFIFDVLKLQDGTLLIWHINDGINDISIFVLKGRKYCFRGEFSHHKAKVMKVFEVEKGVLLSVDESGVGYKWGLKHRNIIEAIVLAKEGATTQSPNATIVEQVVAETMGSHVLCSVPSAEDCVLRWYSILPNCFNNGDNYFKYTNPVKVIFTDYCIIVPLFGGGVAFLKVVDGRNVSMKHAIKAPYTTDERYNTTTELRFEPKFYRFEQKVSDLNGQVVRY